jgi:hypothetical protein
MCVIFYFACFFFQLECVWRYVCVCDSFLYVGITALPVDCVCVFVLYTHSSRLKTLLINDSPR